MVEGGPELEKQKVLEEVKFLTAFGGNDDDISRLAKDLREFVVTYEEVLAAIKEAHDDLASGKIAQKLATDPIHCEVEEEFGRQGTIIDFLPFLRSAQNRSQGCLGAGPHIGRSPENRALRVKSAIHAIGGNASRESHNRRRLSEVVHS